MKTYTETELRQLSEQILYTFRLQLSSKYHYTIDNFIDYFTVEHFTGGKNDPIYYELRYSKKELIYAIVGDRPIVISPEYIFYNFSPVNHIKRRRFYLRLPHNYNNLGYGHSRKNHRVYKRDIDHWTGLGKEIVYYDKILDGYNYAKDNGYRVLHQGRSTHKERSEKNKQSSSGWKYSTKRKRQYK